MKHFRWYLSFRLMIIAGIVTCYCSNVSAQEASDCSKLLRQNVVPEKSQDIVDNIKNHADCFGLDSVDLRLFALGPMLGMLMVDRASKAKGKIEITYGDVLTDINKAKRDTGYTSTRNLVTAQMILEKRSFSPGNWDVSLKYLQIVGMPGGDTEGFHKYALEKQAHHWTYRQLIVGYQMKKEAEAPVKQ